MDADSRTVATQFRALTQGAHDIIAEPELRARLEAGAPLRIKLGIDPTASDIHLGFAVVLRTLRRFQDHGHTAVLILGDFTAQVGDPSGKSATRPRLSKDQVDEYAQSYVEQIQQILDPDPARLEIRRNSEWLAAMGMDEILRLTSRTTVARMLERDDFAKRYATGTPISLTEFLYPLMQGWDSVMVRADVELGGTDQLFNLLVGRHLQAQEGQRPQVVLTTPLLEGLSGGPKMSKSLGNYVGIAEPPSEQFGKVMSIPDPLLRMYAQYTTNWDQPTIDAFVGELDAATLHPNAAKRRIAAAVCDLYHGVGAGAAAEAEFDRVHKQHSLPTDIPEATIGAAPLRLSKLLATVGLAGSAREGVRLIGEGAVRIDGVVQTADEDVQPASLEKSVIQVGRRRFARVRVL